MKNRQPYQIGAMLVLVWACNYSPAQSVYEPYTFTTLAGGGLFLSPWGAALDSGGNVYVAGDHAVQKVSPTGVVTLLAGSGLQGSADGTGAAARFNYPRGVAVDSAGNAYVADSQNNAIRKVTPAGVVTTLAAGFYWPWGIALDNSTNMYVAELQNHTIRKVTPAGVVTTLAGLAGFSGSADGTGSAARFSNPSGVAVDDIGNVYVADRGNNTIRKVTPRGLVTTLAGLAGNQGSVDGTGSSARFSSPEGVAVDGARNIYIGDGRNSTIRKVTPVGIVTTLAGVVGSWGNVDGTGSAARFGYPSGVAVDAVGIVYMTDSWFGGVIRKGWPPPPSSGIISVTATQAKDPLSPEERQVFYQLLGGANPVIAWNSFSSDEKAKIIELLNFVGASPSTEDHRAFAVNPLFSTGTVSQVKSLLVDRAKTFAVSPWNGTVRYSLSGPTNTTGYNVPQTFSNTPPGAYTLSYISGGPTNSVFVDDAGGETQDLRAGGWIYYGLQFLSTEPTAGSILVSATLDGKPWSGPVNFICSGLNYGSGGFVPATFSNVLEGDYSIIFTSGGPANSTSLSVSPAVDQTLVGGSSVSYVLNFHTGPFAYLSALRAFQRPSTAVVDLFYDLSGDSPSYSVSVSVSSDGGATFTVPATHFTGDGVTSPIAPGTSRHIVWDAGADFPGKFSTQMQVRLTVGSSDALSAIFMLDTRAIPVVGNVHATQQPGTTQVELSYDLSGSGAAYSVSVGISCDGGATFAVPAMHFSGDGITSPVAPGTNRRVVWDASADLGAGYFPNVLMRVSAGGPSATSSVFPVNLRGLAGGLKVNGTILDGVTGLPLVFALAQIGSTAAISDAQGRFSIPSIAVGDYTLSVSKVGYAPASVTVSVTPGTSPSRVITLYPLANPGSSPRVASITSKYPDTACYLDGVPFNVQFTATVDWAGHSPGTVQFLTPRSTYAVVASGATVLQTLDVGSAFGPNGRLRVAAVSSDGARSAEFLAKLVVAPNPFPGSLGSALASVDDGGDFHYEASLSVSFFDQAIGAGIIPSDIPGLGEKGLSLDFLPQVNFSVASDGAASFAMDWGEWEGGQVLDRQWGTKPDPAGIGQLLNDLIQKGAVNPKQLPHAGFGGLDVSFYPHLSGTWRYSPDRGTWQYSDAVVGVVGDFSASQTWPFVVMVGPVPVPMFAQVKADVSADETADVLQLAPLSLSGALNVDPALQGSLSVGVNELASASGWVKGNVHLDLQWPQQPTMKDFSVTVSAGFAFSLLGQEQPFTAFTKAWPSSGGLVPLVLQPQGGWRPISRDYIQHSSRGILAPSAKTRLKDDGSGTVTILLSPVFPYSDPNCAASGTNLYLAFLTDNTNRTSMNRTMAMFTKFNGTNWSQTVAIADDGTADFHPRLLSFPDGSAVAAWENEGTTLPDTASLDQMKSNLEVSVAWFNPATGVWLPAQRMTTNGFLDRSPKLAGRSKDNVLLTWIANPANDENGTPAAPNQVWSARWNGVAWSAPQLAATVSNALVKYDLAYDGATANLVLSVDTVPGSTNVDGHELFRVAYQGGAWGPLTQLTADQVPDDNPQLTLDPQGNVVLTWLKGAELSSVANFAMTNRQVLRTNEYSSNLADFTLAASGDGKRALLWAEPSENSSDLFGMFYDPAAQVWGAPKQLTHDPQTERTTSAAFLGEGRLVAVYDRTLISSTNAPGTSPTDLAALIYPLGEDLALDGNLIYSVPANPSPGGTATLHVKALNLGDQVETNLVVAFYRDAMQAASELGRVTLTNALPPQGTTEVTFTWPVPATNNPVAVFAVIDPDQTVPDVSRSNNVVRLDLVKPDLAIQSMSWSRVTSNLLAVTVRVGNDGAIASGPATLSLRQDSASGTNLFSQEVAALAPGESVEVSFVWNVAGLPDNLNLFAVLNGPGVSNNFSTANLTRQLAISQVTPPWLGEGQYLPDGSFQLTMYGEAGRSYTLQASTNLVDWAPIRQFISTNGVMTVVDPAATNSNYRFYRAVTP